MLTTYHFRVLDAHASLVGPDEVLKPVAHAYGRFLVPAAPTEGTHEIRIESANATSFSDGSNTLPVIAGVDLTLQIYERFLNAVFDRVSAYAVVHAGTLLNRRGEALLIAGPSGFGKTSLTLELLRHGFGFLSDDYAPIHLTTGEVAPYPRTVGLLPDGLARMPQSFVEAAADPKWPRLLGKALIDVGDVLGESTLATQPARVGDVVFLDAGEAGDPYRSIVCVGIWPRGVAETDERLRRIEGVKVLERTESGDITVLRVELRHEELSTEEFSNLLNEDFVAFSEARPRSRPDFDREPRLSPLKRREVALLLCREIQNRRPRGSLMQAYDGDTTQLFLDLAGTLTSARCHRLEVGNFKSTMHLLAELTDAH